MTNFANSRFWRVAAVLALVLLALDVAVRYLDRPAESMPALLRSAHAQGGVVFSPNDGIVTTNQSGTIIYRWGRVEGTSGGMTVVKFDVEKKSIDRIDLK